jgi:cystathionine beta-lyase/cystathionine gamma-synthase
VRGLRTLDLRLERHGRGAETDRAAPPGASRRRAGPPAGVATPGAPGLDGVSGLLSFEAAPGLDVERFCDALACFKLGVSWGGHESLVCPALVTLEQAGGPNHARFFGHPAGLVRLNIGLENPETLWRDLAGALQQGRET